MRKQILYLLGAGASAGRLPMINDFASRVEHQKKYLNSINLDLLPKNTTINFVGVFGTYLDELAYLQKILHDTDTPSVDTLAHSFHISGKIHDYLKLKKIYSLFLLLEQRLNFHDNRYTKFISSIISFENNKLPDNVRILSWNYDNQFELAYSHFTNTSNYQKVRSEIGYNTIESQEIHKGFSFTKINGSIDMRQLIHLSDLKMLDKDGSVDPKFTQLCNFLVIVNSTYNLREHQAIEFAWEKKISLQNFNQFKNVTDVVVIGYSFPHCNHIIDKMIFSSIASLDNLYIQCGSSSEEIREKLVQRKYPSIIGMKLHNKHEVSVVKNTDSFHLVY